MAAPPSFDGLLSDWLNYWLTAGFAEIAAELAAIEKRHNIAKGRLVMAFGASQFTGKDAAGVTHPILTDTGGRPIVAGVDAAGLFHPLLTDTNGRLMPEVPISSAFHRPAAATAVNAQVNPARGSSFLIQAQFIINCVAAQPPILCRLIDTAVAFWESNISGPIGTIQVLTTPPVFVNSFQNPFSATIAAPAAGNFAAAFIQAQVATE